MTQGQLLLLILGSIPYILFARSAWMTFNENVLNGDYTFWEWDSTGDPFWHHVFAISHIVAFTAIMIASIVALWDKPLINIL